MLASRAAAAALLSALLALAPTTPAKAQGTKFTVRQDSVRAHEEFLSSDALAGRGSATRDEAIAAAYVGSEFRTYGLQPAPGAASFVQTAEVVAPVLDGHATLAAAAVQAEQGPGFRLVASSGASLTGPLVVVDEGAATLPGTAKGAVVLVNSASGTSTSALLGRFYRLAARGGVLALLVTRDGTTPPEAPPPMHLQGMPERHTLSVAALAPELVHSLAALPGGTPVVLRVHQVPNTPTRQTSNAVGYLPGSDPAAGTLLLSAHLDHLGVRPAAAVGGDAIYNGANDDASGTTAVLELAEALAGGGRLRRSVLFVCYGSEEAGELGSTYFGEHPPVPLGKLVANLEFEMIGNQDPKMPKGVLLFTGWDRSNLGPTLKAHGALLGPDPYPEQHFFERSDNYALALKGVVAHTAAGWGTPPTYHQPNDDMEHLDVRFMTAAIQSLIEPVRWLAAGSFTPSWNAGGRPGQ